MILNIYWPRTLPTSFGVLLNFSTGIYPNEVESTRNNNQGRVIKPALGHKWEVTFKFYIHDMYN